MQRAGCTTKSKKKKKSKNNQISNLVIGHTSISEAIFSAWNHIKIRGEALITKRENPTAYKCYTHNT